MQNDAVKHFIDDKTISGDILNQSRFIINHLQAEKHIIFFRNYFRAFLRSNKVDK